MLNDGKAGFALNLALAALWLYMSIRNVQVVVSRPDAAQVAVMLCVVDMLVSRADLGLAWCIKTGNKKREVYDKVMNRFAMLAAAGAGLYMPLAGAAAAGNKPMIAYMIPAAALSVISYVLTILSRRAPKA